jgi:hypothetical protein
VDINRSPSEFFAMFLISQQKHDVGTIVHILEDHGLYAVHQRYIERLKEKMLPFPEPWAPTPNLGTESEQLATREYLRAHGIHDLWYPSAAAQEAFQILGNPRLRESTEQLLLSPLRIEETVRRLNEHHKVKLTAEGVEAFGHYFWNRKLLSMGEWVAFMDDKPAAYSRIVTLKASPDVADMVVPWLAGMSGPPSSINTGAVARRMRDVAFLKVLEIEREPASLDHANMMSKYMSVIKAAEDEMRQSDVALREVLNAFEKFRMRKDDHRIPAIEDVAGVNYSQSGGGTDMMSEADRLLEEADG